MISNSLEKPSIKTPAPAILLALSKIDRETFFPGLNMERELGPGARWLDVTGLDPNKWECLLGDAAPEVLVTGWGTPTISDKLARQPGLPLRYLCHLAGGVHAIVPRALLERGVLVSNWGSAISHTIAEQAILLTLGALRNLPLWNSFMEMPEDRVTRMRVHSLRGKRVGLHGFGAIAREIARMLKPFRVDLSAYSHGVPPELFASQGVRRCESLKELFSGCEVLIECEALTLENRKSVTGALLDLLAPDAVFVNVGRGAVTDEPALVQRAAQGKIRLALDVYVQEPPAPDSPLLQLENVLLSPHIAGPTADARPLCGKYALDNLHRYFQGEPVEGLVTLEAYDRLQ